MLRKPFYACINATRSTPTSGTMLPDLGTTGRWVSYRNDSIYESLILNSNESRLTCALSWGWPYPTSMSSTPSTCLHTCSPSVFSSLWQLYDAILLTRSTGGYCIRQPCERAHTVQYLQKVDDVIKWKTRRLIQTLEKEWEEMDNFEKR